MKAAVDRVMDPAVGIRVEVVVGGGAVCWPWGRFLLAPGQISRSRFLACTIRCLGNFQETRFYPRYADFSPVRAA